MARSDVFIDILKRELRACGVTYARVAEHLQLAESTVKHMFADKDCVLTRMDEILELVNLEFTDLARLVLEAQPLTCELTQDQERVIVADTRLLLVALSCLSSWTLEDIVAVYDISTPQCVGYFATLDRLGVIELRPLNRYKLRVDKTFRWRPNGPAMQWFREHALTDFFDDGFGNDDELFQVVYGNLPPAAVVAFNERLKRLAAEFAAEHQVVRKAGRSDLARRGPYTMVLGVRKWWLPAFRKLMRESGKRAGVIAGMPGR